MSLIDTVRTFCDALWNEHNPSVIADLFSEDVLLESPLNAATGIKAYEKIAQRWLTAFPDLQVHWDEFVADEDTVVCRWHAHGSHQGTFLERAPTGKSVDYSGVTFFTFEEGKVSHYWAMVDMQQIFSQLDA